MLTDFPKAAAVRARVLLRHGRLDSADLISHRLPLSDADAYDLFDRREAFKVVLTPDEPDGAEGAGS